LGVRVVHGVQRFGRSGGDDIGQEVLARPCALAREPGAVHFGSGCAEHVGLGVAGHPGAACCLAAALRGEPEGAWVGLANADRRGYDASVDERAEINPLGCGLLYAAVAVGDDHDVPISLARELELLLGLGVYRRDAFECRPVVFGQELVGGLRSGGAGGDGVSELEVIPVSSGSSWRSSSGRLLVALVGRPVVRLTVRRGAGVFTSGLKARIVCAVSGCGYGRRVMITFRERQIVCVVYQPVWVLPWGRGTLARACRWVFGLPARTSLSGLRDRVYLHAIQPSATMTAKAATEVASGLNVPNRQGRRQRFTPGGESFPRGGMKLPPTCWRNKPGGPSRHRRHVGHTENLTGTGRGRHTRRHTSQTSTALGARGGRARHTTSIIFIQRHTSQTSTALTNLTAPSRPTPHLPEGLQSSLRDVIHRIHSTNLFASQGWAPNPRARQSSDHPSIISTIPGARQRFDTVGAPLRLGARWVGTQSPESSAPLGRALTVGGHPILESSDHDLHPSAELCTPRQSSDTPRQSSDPPILMGTSIRSSPWLGGHINQVVIHPNLSATIPAEGRHPG